MHNPFILSLNFSSLVNINRLFIDGKFMQLISVLISHCLRLWVFVKSFHVLKSTVSSLRIGPDASYLLLSIGHSVNRW